MVKLIERTSFDQIARRSGSKHRRYDIFAGRLTNRYQTEHYVNLSRALRASVLSETASGILARVTWERNRGLSSTILGQQVAFAQAACVKARSLANTADDGK
jgi:hypothetical protein